MTQSDLELHSERVRVVIERRGARMSSLRVDGREFLVSATDNALLWGCYPMVPWVGRLGRGRFSLADRHHRMPINLAPHAIHGLGMSRDWVPCPDGRSLDLELSDPWPFGGTAHLDLSLAPGSLTITLSVTAGRQSMPVTIGLHPVFRKHIGRDVAELSFDPEHMWARGGDGLPTGERVVVPPGPWDDCFGGVATSPRITWSDGCSFVLESPTATWVVYDETPHALCVEPQTGIPDAFNHADCPVLEPGETVSLPLTIRWTTAEAGSRITSGPND